MGIEQFKIKTIQQPSEITLEALQVYIADVCQVVRNKEPKSAEKLWNRLLTEAYGDKASSVFKFIPCKLTHKDFAKYVVSDTSFQQEFGFWYKTDYYTTAMELLNVGMSVDDMISFVDFRHFKAYKGLTMFKVYQQMRTHSQLAWLSHSQRYTQTSEGYFVPEECSDSTSEDWEFIVENSAPVHLEAHMKLSGVKRREIYALGKDMLQLRTFSMAGYTNNPNALPHFFEERSTAHTQLETREYVKSIKEHDEVK